MLEARWCYLTKLSEKKNGLRFDLHWILESNCYIEQPNNRTIQPQLVPSSNNSAHALPLDELILFNKLFKTKDNNVGDHTSSECVQIRFSVGRYMYMHSPVELHCFEALV